MKHGDAPTTSGRRLGQVIANALEAYGAVKDGIASVSLLKDIKATAASQDAGDLVSRLCEAVGNQVFPF